jgi:chorismate mutase
MSDATASERVVDMVDYLRETIGEIDEMVVDLQAKRAGLAIRLAALEMATDAEVSTAAGDYEARVATGRPYESAEDAETLIAEAHRHYVP